MTDNEKLYICPIVEKCKQAVKCTHRRPHQRQTGSLSPNGAVQDFCRPAFGVCPACVVYKQ